MTAPELSPSQAIERSVIKKILTRLIPFLSFLYAFNIIDRGNISIAALTMQTDLHLTDRAYAAGVAIFYIGYFIFEVPSNLVMERVGARRWIARIMFSWGVISALMMLVRGPVSLCILRFLLGVAEAGFYPGILLYLTYWIPGYSRTRILAGFLALNGLMGLISNPLGSVLMRMNGVGGLAGWQWLFLVEGVPSALLGFAVLKFLPDGPKDTNWLTEEEKSWITASLAQEERTSQNVKHLSFRVALSDRRILHLCLIFFLTAVATNAVGSFAPKMIEARSNGNWKPPDVALYSMAPALVGAIAMFLSAFHSDRTGARRTHVLLGYIIAGCGYLYCAFITGPGVTPAMLTLLALAINQLGERIAAGSYWTLTTNLMGARAAAGGIAFINSVGNLGGFFGPPLMAEFRTRTHGGFKEGMCMAAGLFFAAAIGAYLLRRDTLSTPTRQDEFIEEVAALAQPEQHIP